MTVSNAKVMITWDFQIKKVILLWIQSVQLGENCYCQKMIHQGFGIVDECQKLSHGHAVYETVAGQEDSYHDCSFSMNYAIQFYFSQCGA